MNVIKAEQPNITAVVDDLYKPFVAYKSLRSLSIKPEDLFLVYRFFISDLVMSGKLDDENIDETVRDMIMWFVSNHMTDTEKKFFNKLMVNLLDMTGLHKKNSSEEINDVSEDTDEDDFNDTDFDEESIDDSFDNIDFDDESTEDIPDDVEELDDGDESEELPTEDDVFDAHDIDPVAISKCYQCKSMTGESDNYTCNYHNKSINYLCSTKFSWEHLCPNFEYQNNKGVNDND